ncbi:Rz1-like lysis system protein LysC [Shewanella scandinavica]
MKQLKNGLIAACLMSLISCSNMQPIVRTVTVSTTQYVTPPRELLSYCQVPDYSGKTNNDLYHYAQALIAEIARCNVDWDALHKWIEEHSNEQRSK